MHAHEACETQNEFLRILTALAVDAALMLISLIIIREINIRAASTASAGEYRIVRGYWHFTAYNLSFNPSTRLDNVKNLWRFVISPALLIFCIDLFVF